MDPLRLSGAGGAPDSEFEIPEGGGLVVLRGHNGAGKSQALLGIEDLTTGSKNLRVKNGRTRGEISGFGAEVRLGARTTRRGELEVVGLTSRMDVAGIVDPGLKDYDAANRAIVKAVVRMLGIEPRVDLFHELAGARQDGESDEDFGNRLRATFNELMPAGLDESVDLVEMAAKIKKGFESAARRAKGEAEQVQGEADALLAAGDGLDFDAESDSDKLQAALEEAIRVDGALKERTKARQRLQAEADAARESVGEGGGPNEDDFVDAHQNVADASKTQDEAMQLKSAAEEGLESARVALREAEHKLELAKGSAASALVGFDAADAALEALEDGEKAWKAALGAIRTLEEAEPAPGPDDLEAAAGATAAARDAVERGALVRDARERREYGRQRRRDAAALKGREQDFREAGRGTDAVLSRLINEAGIEQLQVVDGEVLAIAPGEQGFRPFLHMSDGQRTRIACDVTIPVALRAVPEGELAVIVLGQRVYQDLDYDNRRRLVEHVQGRRVLLYTALPTEGDLEAVIADPESGEGITG